MVWWLTAVTWGSLEQEKIAIEEKGQQAIDKLLIERALRLNER